MTSVSEHQRKIKEHLQEIKDALDEGLEHKPVTLGFHMSACATELLELYLHKLNLISLGKTIKHNWFEKPKLEQKILPIIERKLPVSFPDKDKIYHLIYTIEEHRDNLIYGKNSPVLTQVIVKNFMELKELLEKKLKELGEDIE